MAGALMGDGQLPHEVSDEQPGGAWVMRSDGQRVDLVVEQGDRPGEWVASPQGGAVVMLRRGDRLGVSLHQGQSVRFDRVWSEAGEPLVIEEN